MDIPVLNFFVPSICMKQNSHVIDPLCYLTVRSVIILFTYVRLSISTLQNPAKIIARQTVGLELWIIDDLSF